MCVLLTASITCPFTWDQLQPPFDYNHEIAQEKKVQIKKVQDQLYSGGAHL